jgi:hypothetical protein
MQEEEEEEEETVLFQLIVTMRLHCDTVLCGIRSPTFKKNILLPSSG